MSKIMTVISKIKTLPFGHGLIYASGKGISKAAAP
jgi:hypothetical protein